MITSKKETPVKAIAEPQQNEVESLKKQIADLQIQLKSQPLSLEEKIKFYQAKQDNILKLNRLDGFADSLVTIGEEAQNSIGENEFSSEKFAVAITRKDYSYKEGSKILEINNPVLVVEVLGFALERINAKRATLRTLIEA
jgi:hypothetical protein